MVERRYKRLQGEEVEEGIGLCFVDNISVAN